MKTIGIIGGTSWVSTIDYYRLINRLTNEKLGMSNAARLILYSVNFQDFKNLLDVDDWKTIASLFSEMAIKLQNAGADCILLAANTPHLIAEEVQQAVSVPLIHIADAVGKEIRNSGLSKVLLLGTKFVMERNFFRDRLQTYGIETLLPNEAERNFLHDSIFNELTRDIFTEETKQKYLEIINRSLGNGAEGVIYACTEIPILLKDELPHVKTFDTTWIHAKAAVEFALG